MDVMEILEKYFLGDLKIPATEHIRLHNTHLILNSTLTHVFRL